MNWVEFAVDSECPHCGEENTDHVEFNMDESSFTGVDSPVKETECESCLKKYYFRARFNFDFETSMTWKDKPKVLK